MEDEKRRFIRDQILGRLALSGPMETKVLLDEISEVAFRRKMEIFEREFLEVYQVMIATKKINLDLDCSFAWQCGPVLRLEDAP